jgi:hypothetical protein
MATSMESWTRATHRKLHIVHFIYITPPFISSLDGRNQLWNWADSGRWTSDDCISRGG